MAADFPARIDGSSEASTLQQTDAAPVAALTIIFSDAPADASTTVAAFAAVEIPVNTDATTDAVATADALAAAAAAAAVASTLTTAPDTTDSTAAAPATADTTTDVLAAEVAAAAVAFAAREIDLPFGTTAPSPAAAPASSSAADHSDQAASPWAAVLQQEMAATRVLLITGAAGSGKSAFVAAAARAAALALDYGSDIDTKDHSTEVLPQPTRPAGVELDARTPSPPVAAPPTAVLVVRFVGMTADSLRLPTLLSSICMQLSVAFGASPPRASEVGQLHGQWRKWLSLASPSRQILLLLDGIDQLEAGPLDWLMYPPPHVRILLTCRDTMVETMKNFLPHLTAGMLHLPPLGRPACAYVLDAVLGSLSRRLAPTQRERLLEAALQATMGFTSHDGLHDGGDGSDRVGGGCLPLHIELMGIEAAGWTSPPADSQADVDIDGTALPCDLRRACRRLLDIVEAEHGTALVAATCGLLCVCRDGLSRTELLHILSCCDDVLVASLVATAQRLPAQARLPPASLRLLLHHLSPNLFESLSAAFTGSPLLRWRHALRDAAAARYCSGAGATRWFGLLADFFSGVTPPPFTFTFNGATAQMPTGRGLPEQPLQLRTGSSQWSNRRALRELVSALLGSGRWHQLAQLVCSLDWLKVKLHSLGVGQLLDDFALVSAAAQTEGLMLMHHNAIAQLSALGAVLLEASNALEEDGNQLELQLLARLPHHTAAGTREAPLLEGLLLQAELSLQRQQSHMSKVAAPTSLVHGGSERISLFAPRWPCLPAGTSRLSARFHPASPVTTASASPDGSLVACGCEDGALYLYWPAAGVEVAILLFAIC